MDSSSRSPIYALFSETLEGLACIRAYTQEDKLTKKCYELLDSNQEAYFLKFSANCWLAVRLEFAGTLIVTCAALFAVLYRDDSNTQSEKVILTNENVFCLIKIALYVHICLS